MVEKIMKMILVNILHLKLSEKRLGGIVQFTKFGVVGLTNTVISYIIYLVAFLFFQTAGLWENVDYLISQIIAFVLSVLWSFYWNNRYVFAEKKKGERNFGKALLKTYVSYAFTGLFLNSILAVVWVQVLGVSKLAAPIINLLISVPVNFLMNKFWAFR